MKRFLSIAVLLLSLCQLALAQQVAPLPGGERYDAPATFVTETEGESLRIMVEALARSIGLTPIVENVPDTTITINIDEPKPFRQLWNTVLTLYGLDYVLQENDVVIVGPAATLAALKPDDQMAGLPAAQAGSDSPPPTLRVYRLANAKASVLAEVLQSSGLESSVVSNDAPVADEIDGAVVNNDPVEQERAFTVVADDRTNTLIVTATPDIQAQIADLIPSLDIAQQQVNVQVRIQEISQRAANNLGIDLTAGLGSFASTILGGSLNFIFDAQNNISGLNLGAVMDTLETQGLSRRVDDGNMTVLNNGTGRMKSGGRIEITFDGADGDTSSRTIEFGVILEVTPRVSSDGRIILDVSAEVSDLLTPFSEGGIPQRIDFSERLVSSTVTLEPGQTVLMSGLLQSEFTSSESGVPILSSLPLVGNLFKQTQLEDNSSELLLIVTADVVE